MNMKSLITGLSALFIYSLAAAQQPGSISGKVLDGQRQPLEFASVYLALQSDTSAIVGGAITDAAGHFSLEKIQPGDYFLNVQFVGYEQQRQALRLEKGNMEIVLPDIVLAAGATALKGVEVSAMRDLIRKTEEGIVINASENLTQIGGSAADLLKNMPGVLLGSEGEITLRGKSPLVLVNGRVSGIGGADRSANLEQIPASSIERIEIITNPSSKYAADAEGGIINLILKKNTGLGTSGAAALGGGLGDHYRINGSLLLNHNAQKWNAGLAYDNWFTTRTRRVDGDRVQYDVPDAYFLTQRRNDERTVKTQTARLNLDFAPDPKNSLGFEAIWLFEGQDNFETVVSTTKTEGRDFTGKDSRYAGEFRRFNTGEASLNYARKFDKPEQSLRLNASSSLELNRENTDLSSQALSGASVPIGSPFLQKTRNYEDANLSNFSADYAHPVFEKGTLETGYKATVRSIKTDFLRSDQVNGGFETDAANTDIFHFDEQIHAAYLQYEGWTGGEKEAPRWKFGAGLRAEQVSNRGETEKRPTNFTNDYFNLFPSARLVFYTPGRDMVKFSYSRRINRPSLGSFSPFVDITDTLNPHAGNPNLKPELAHSLELSYDFSLGKGSLAASAFYRNTSNIILTYTALNSNGIALQQPRNFGNAATLGMEGIFSYPLLDFWRTNLTVSGYHLRIEETDPALNIQRDQFTWFVKCAHDFTLWKNARLQIAGNYTSPFAIPQGERKAVGFVDLGFQQKILKGQGRLALTLTDIFNTQQGGYRISDARFRFDRTVKVDTRAVMLIFGYTFRSEFREKLLENKFKND
jgi:outer membrane receptor protein involved in Fe transport